MGTLPRNRHCGRVGGRRGSHDPIFPRGVRGPMKVTDPVCGMVIESGTAASHGTYGAETVYFCSLGCQKAYERTHPRTG
jgi:YHS domain-containing protein